MIVSACTYVPVVTVRVCTCSDECVYIRTYVSNYSDGNCIYMHTYLHTYVRTYVCIL